MSEKDSPLSDRFEGRKPDEDNANDTNDSDNSNGSSVTSDSTNTGDADTTSDNDNVRERKQEAMYLRPEQRQELREFYEELDARSKLAGEGGLTKNDDFYEGLVSFVIDENREEFKEFLGLGDVE